WNGKPAPSTYLHKQLDVTRAVRLLDFSKAVIHIIKPIRARPRIPFARSGPAGYHTRVGSPPLPCGAFFFTFRHAGIAHAGALRCPRGTPGTSKMYKKHSALIVLSTFHYPASPSGPVDCTSEIQASHLRTGGWSRSHALEYCAGI